MAPKRSFWVVQVFQLAADYFFFEEFRSRFNTVAVDYLIYPHEVFINIWDSYPVAWVLFGCINAFLIYRFKIPTLIVTLGTASIFHGAYLTLAKVPHIYQVPPYFFEFSTKFIFSWTKRGGPTIGLSTLTFMMLAIALVTWLLLRRK